MLQNLLTDRVALSIIAAIIIYIYDIFVKKYVLQIIVYIKETIIAPSAPKIHPSIDLLGLTLLNLCFFSPKNFPAKYADISVAQPANYNITK